jgi:hypothetical protein
MTLMNHPIYLRLLAPGQAIERHALLHDMERHLTDAGRCPGLATRVRHFVERGVPYFAPQDPHYCEWAARAAALWDELTARRSEPLAA